MPVIEPQHHFYKLSQASGHLVFAYDDKPPVSVRFTQGVSLLVYLEASNKPSFVIRSTSDNVNILSKEECVEVASGETPNDNSSQFDPQLSCLSVESGSNEQIRSTHHDEFGLNHEEGIEEAEDEDIDFAVEHERQTDDPLKHGTSEAPSDITEHKGSFISGTVTDSNCTSNGNNEQNHSHFTVQAIDLDASTGICQPALSDVSLFSKGSNLSTDNVKNETCSNDVVLNSCGTVNGHLSKEQGESLFSVRNVAKEASFGTSQSLNVTSDFGTDLQSESLSDVVHLPHKNNRESSSLHFQPPSTSEDVCASDVKARAKRFHRKNLTCELCQRSFSKVVYLVAHQRSSPSYHYCHLCDGRAFTCKADLIVHLQRHKSLSETDIFEIISLSYEDAQKKCKDYKNYERLPRVQDQENCTCLFCGTKQSTRRGLARHTLKHTKENYYTCCVCGFGCILRSTLMTHARVHNGKKRIECQICKERFATRAELCKHKRDKHGHECGFCGLNFSVYRMLQYHYRVHHSDCAIKCSLVNCNRFFSSQKEMESHRKIHRAPTKQCPECGKFVAVLEKHMLVHKSLDEMDDSEKIFCDKCPSVFKFEKEYQRHQYKHATVRSFTCDECSKSFKSPSCLMRHKKFVHAQLKTYDCSVCGKKCSRKCNLKVHMRIHGNTKVFPCGLCSDAFNYKSSLQKHMKSKHNCDAP